MKIIDETETQTKNKPRQERSRGAKAIVKGLEINDFVVRLRQVF